MPRKMGTKLFPLERTILDLKNEPLLADCLAITRSLNNGNKKKFANDSLVIFRWLLERVAHSRRVSKVLENKLASFIEAKRQDEKDKRKVVIIK